MEQKRYWVDIAFPTWTKCQLRSTQRTLMKLWTIFLWQTSKKLEMTSKTLKICLWEQCFRVWQYSLFLAFWWNIRCLFGSVCWWQVLQWWAWLFLWIVWLMKSIKLTNSRSIMKSCIRKTLIGVLWLWKDLFQCLDFLLSYISAASAAISVPSKLQQKCSVYRRRYSTGTSS